MLQNWEVTAVIDPPHLLKCTCSVSLKHDVANGGAWDYCEWWATCWCCWVGGHFDAVCSVYRLLHKVTERHTKPCACTSYGQCCAAASTLPSHQVRTITLWAWMTHRLNTGVTELHFMLSWLSFNYQCDVGNLTSCTFFIFLTLSYVLFYVDVLLQFVFCIAVCSVLCADWCIALRVLQVRSIAVGITTKKVHHQKLIFLVILI